MFLMCSNAHDISFERFASVLMLYLEEGVFLFSVSKVLCKLANPVDGFLQNLEVLGLFKIQSIPNFFASTCEVSYFF